MGALVEFNTPIPNDICVHEDDTSESDALHLPIAYDIPRKIAICNEHYNFVAYPQSILQEFAVNNDVMVTIHFERFPSKIERTLHARRI